MWNLCNSFHGPYWHTRCRGRFVQEAALQTSKVERDAPLSILSRGEQRRRMARLMSFGTQGGPIHSLSTITYRSSAITEYSSFPAHSAAVETGRDYQISSATIRPVFSRGREAILRMVSLSGACTELPVFQYT